MPSTKREFYMVCPHCWSVRVKVRMLKKPRYKCEKCHTKFPNKKRVSHEERLLFNDKLKQIRDSHRKQYTRHTHIDLNDILTRHIAIREMKERENKCLK